MKYYVSTWVHLSNMKASQGVLVIGWIILCSAVLFLFNDQLSYQLPILKNYDPNITNVLSFTHQGRQSFTRLPFDFHTIVTFETIFIFYQRKQSFYFF